MVEFFSNLIGPYPYEKLALVQSSTRYGGMENSSSVFLAENVFSEGTNSHEIAHQWFGDSVTEADWHHLWLSEFSPIFRPPLFRTRRRSRQIHRADARGQSKVRQVVSVLWGGRASDIRPYDHRVDEAAQREQRIRKAAGRCTCAT